MFGISLFALILGFGVIIVDLLGLMGSDSSDSGAGLDAADEALMLPDTKQGRWVYKALNTLRSFIYFCVGFGAVGVFGSLTNRPWLNTLLWSAATGVLVLVIVKLIMKFQNNVLDSQLQPGDLLLAEAEVLVTIPPGKLGRIRVHSGGSYHDLFAKGKEKEKEYVLGTKVYIVDISASDPIVHTDKI